MCFLNKIISIISVILIIFLVVPSSAQDVENIEIAMVTDIGGLNDESYNDQLWEGLEQAEENLTIDIKVMESNLMTDYLPNLNQLAEENANLIWAVGFSMKQAVKEAAQMYPETSFAIIDAELELENVLSVNFAVEEAAYLAGAAAALKSESSKIAFIGGRENNILKSYEAGFRAGAIQADQDIEIISRYVGSFDKPTAAEDTALNLYRDGADVIFHAAGAGSKKIIDAALENGFYVIGVDRQFNDLAPDNILTTVVKNISTITARESENFYYGDFETGIRSYGLKEDGGGLDNKQLQKLTSQDIFAEIERLRQLIIDGEIDVPNEIDEVQ